MKGLQIQLRILFFIILGCVSIITLTPSEFVEARLFQRVMIITIVGLAFFTISPLVDILLRSIKNVNLEKASDKEVSITRKDGPSIKINSEMSTSELSTLVDLLLEKNSDDIKVRISKSTRKGGNDG